MKEQEQISKLVEELIKSALSGNIEKEEITLTIKLNVKLIELFKYLSTTQNCSLEEMLSTAATEGVNRYFQDLRKFMGDNTPKENIHTEPPIPKDNNFSEFEKKVTDTMQIVQRIQEVTDKLSAFAPFLGGEVPSERDTNKDNKAGGIPPSSNSCTE